MKHTTFNFFEAIDYDGNVLMMVITYKAHVYTY